jgi:hypothetical protein
MLKEVHDNSRRKETVLATFLDCFTGNGIFNDCPNVMKR